MADQDQDKEQRTEQATPKRRRESREKGRVARSKEVSSVFVMIGGMLAFYFLSTQMFRQMMGLTTGLFLESVRIELNSITLNTLFQKMLKEFLIIVAPIMAITMFFGLVANVMQTGGFLFSSEGISLKFSKINPLKGIGRLFSKQSLAELIKSLGKIFIVGYIAYITVKAEFFSIPQLMDHDSWSILKYIGGVSFTIFLRTVLVLIILALIDYAFQRYEFEESIKMTKDEIKKEQKEAEGDSIVKSRIRSVQRDMARRRMMKVVPEADVIITNPIRLAIALKYDKSSMVAPQVIAMGAGYIAQRIREIAKEKHIPIVENKPLAQMLYKFAKVDEIIPERFYKAVAEILAYVYRLKGASNQ